MAEYCDCMAFLTLCVARLVGQEKDRERDEKRKEREQKAVSTGCGCCRRLRVVLTIVLDADGACLVSGLFQGAKKREREEKQLQKKAAKAAGGGGKAKDEAEVSGDR